MRMSAAVEAALVEAQRLSDEERKKKLALALRSRTLARARALQSDLGEPGREGGLIHFIQYFWHILEPNTTFVDGWAMRAICMHLEAVTRGEIKRLLINVSPGFAKSLIVNVFWPIWEWSAAGQPWHRYVTFAYASYLTERDNERFRDVAISEEFRELWGHAVKLTKAGVIKPSNEHKGWKFSSSIDGVGTGERGSRVLCLPYDEPILTDAGWLKIGDVVEGRLAVKIAGYDHASGRVILQDIEAYERNPGNEIVEISCEGGSLRCTRDHPVFIQGRGYARADSIQPGEQVVWGGRDLNLPPVRNGDQAQTEPQKKVLQQTLSHRVRERSGAELKFAAMRDVWKGRLPTTSAFEAIGRSLLQSRMSRKGKQRCGEYRLCGRAGQQILRNMWHGVFCQTRRCRQSAVLQPVMSRSCEMGSRRVLAIKTIGEELLGLWQGVHASLARLRLLLSTLCECSAFGPDHRSWKWSFRAWQSAPEISNGMDRRAQGSHSRAGWRTLPTLWSSKRRKAEFACASHRLQQGQSESFESDHTVPILSRQDAWVASSKSAVETRVVIAVKSAGRENIVYNVRVGPSHNYFAGCILVHNCDDIHNIREGESEKVRTGTVQWVKEGMSNRLNDMENSVIVGIGQRVHYNDASEAMLETGDYCHLCIPMEYDPSRHCRTSIGWEDPRTEYGELAWEERYPRSVVESIKRTVGPYAWAAQYQQTPEPRGGGILKRDWWGVYELAVGASFRHRFDYIIGSLDPAFTARQENDPSGFVIFGVYTDGPRIKICLLHAWKRWLELHGQTMERLPTETNKDYVKRASPNWGLVEWVAYDCTRMRVDMLLVEDKASGHSVAQELQRLYSERKWSVRLNKVGALDKRARAYAIQHLFADNVIEAPASVDGDLYVYREWAQMVIDECAAFRGLPGEEDNLVDAVTQAIKFLRDNGLAVRAEEGVAEEMERRRHKPQREALYPA